jgi:hypothetical protein
MMHGHEKSDPNIVAVKPANKAGQSTCGANCGDPNAAESVERRAGTKGNADQQSTRRTQRRESVTQALARIRHAIAVWTQGGSRMRESCMSGSVRGALGNERPYRDSDFCCGAKTTRMAAPFDRCCSATVCRQSVESECGAAAVGWTYLLPPLSSGGA